MAERAATLLRRIERLKLAYGDGVAERKLELLRELHKRRFTRSSEVHRFHETLAFWRAYPDSPAVLALVERILAAFSRRSDLLRHSEALADTGIAGAPIYFSFFWPTAIWLSRRWPEKISIDWSAFENQDRLIRILHLLILYTETPGPDMLDLSPREWIDRLKGPTETDATFLIRRFQALDAEAFTCESLYEDLDVPILVSPGPDTPARTHARYGRGNVTWQRGPLLRSRPDLRREIHRPPVAVRAVSRREGERLIDLAREAMVTRSRDLWAFNYADRDDVRLVDCGGGLRFVCIGNLPERRLMLEAMYGFLTLKNGVPIGYVLSSSLFGSTEVAYNVFETFRGAEAGYVFGRVMAMTRHLFGSDVYALDPYQLGHGNPEGLKSGAWWFYYKIGFRSHNPKVLRVLRGELSRMKKDPRHRSTIATLTRLTTDYLYFHLGHPREDVLGRVALGQIGLRVSRYVAERFGADREAATRTCSREAAGLLGLRSLRGFSAGERLMWERWSPMILALPGLSRWTAARKAALIRVVRAKGGRRESDFVRLFNGHRPLRSALLRLAEDGNGDEP